MPEMLQSTHTADDPDACRPIYLWITKEYFFAETGSMSDAEKEQAWLKWKDVVPAHRVRQSDGLIRMLLDCWYTIVPPVTVLQRGHRPLP